MNNQTNLGHLAYNRLLTDIREKSGLPLGTPDVTDEWVSIEGPKLDKELLQYIEGNGNFPIFPDWLLPLSERFRKTQVSLNYVDMDIAPGQEPPPLHYKVRRAVADDLRWLRQLLVFCYKIEREPTNAQLQASQEVFVDTDSSIDIWDAAFLSATRPISQSVLSAAHKLISRVICKINWQEIKPSHGPGAVFPPRSADEKSNFCTIYDTIQRRYPADQYFCGIPSYWDHVFVHGNDRLNASDRIVSKLVAVPKDSRGPRLISVHPSEAIWIQQGQRKLLEHAIESSPLTREAISFRDQTRNGNLALVSSETREYTTLDLSEASDRISCLLVSTLFGVDVYDVLCCARSSHVKLFNGSLHSLRKWAPMGNALCFPVESLIFWALVRAAIETCPLRLVPKQKASDVRQVFVFGDDIIFPKRYQQRVLGVLVGAGMKPNTGKTFFKGFFRESCGIEAYHGIDITPLRMRTGNVITTQGIVSNLSLAKRLREQGYECVSSLLYSSIRKVLGSLPLSGDPDSQGLVEYVQYDLGKLMKYERTLSWDRHLHRWRVRCRQVKTRVKRVSKDDWYHLQDSLLKVAYATNEVSRGLEYPLPYAARLSYGWTKALP